MLLFRKTKEGLRFEDEMVYEGHHIERALDRLGNERNALVFELRSLEGVSEAVEAEGPSPNANLDELLKRALSAANNEPSSPTEGKRNVYQRSQDVRFYVLARADGRCEGCELRRPSYVRTARRISNRTTSDASVMEGLTTRLRYRLMSDVPPESSCRCGRGGLQPWPFEENGRYPAFCLKVVAICSVTRSRISILTDYGA